MNFVDIYKTFSKYKKEMASFGDSSEELLNLAVQDNAKAENSTNALAKGLNAVSAATGVSSAAILKYAGIAGAAIAGVSIIVQQYKKHWEELNKQADAASESYTNTVSSIEEYKAQITSLKGSLASGNLTEEEAYNVRVQLLSIQDELIEKYGLEANALNILGETADATNEKLDGITKNEALRNLDENSQAYEKAAKKMEKQWANNLVLGGLTMDDSFMKELNSFLNEYDGILTYVKKAGGSDFIKVTGDTTEAYNAVNDLYDFILSYGDEFSLPAIDNKAFLSATKTLLGNLEDVFAEYHDRYESYLIQSIAADPEASGIMNTVEGYVTALQTAISSGDWSAVSKNIDLLSGINLEDSDLPENIKEYIQGIIDEAVSAAEEYEININLDTKFNPDTNVKSQVKEYLKAFENETGNIDYAALQNASVDLTSATAEQAQAYQMIQILCGAYGATVLQVTDYLAENGEVTLQVAEATEEETTELADLNDVLSTTADRVETLTSAMAEMGSGDGLEYDTVISLIKELTEAGEDYLDYLSIENGQIKLNTAAYREYANAEANALLAGLREEEASLQAGLGEVGSGQGLANASAELSGVQEKIAIIEALLAESKSEVTYFFDAFDAAKDKLSVIDEIREAVSTGGFTNTEALEWLQEIPELAPYYDVTTNSFINLEDALNSIVETDVTSFLEQTNEYLAENTDITEEARAEVLALQGAYVDLADQTRATNKYTTLLNKGISSTTKPFAKIKKQISNLWN